jgi:glucan phosphorylase
VRGRRRLVLGAASKLLLLRREVARAVVEVAAAARAQTRRKPTTAVHVALDGVGGRAVLELERVGGDNIMIFGMSAAEVDARRAAGYNPRETIESDPTLADTLASIAAGLFSPGDPTRYHPLIDSLYNSDFFMVAADFSAYADAQRKIDALWGDRNEWMRKAMINTANMGWFSSDRTIREYADEIWNAPHWRAC